MKKQSWHFITPAMQAAIIESTKGLFSFKPTPEILAQIHETTREAMAEYYGLTREELAAKIGETPQ